MSEHRLFTAEDLLQKAIRKNGVNFGDGPNSTLMNEIFKIGFFIGLEGMNEFVNEVSHLDEEEMIVEIQGILKETDNYLNKNSNEADTS